MADAPDFVVQIITNTLTDGSRTYDVVAGDHVFPCVTAYDAEEMADKIVAAINDHTNMVAWVMGD